MLNIPSLSNNEVNSIYNQEKVTPFDSQSNSKNHLISNINTNAKRGYANQISFPKHINKNDNLIPTQTLDAFDFDSENTCKDMLEQVKKVEEYNTNFINKQKAQNKSGNDLNAFWDQKNNGNSYRSSNSMYSNSVKYNNLNNNNFGLEINSPLNIGTTRDNAASSYNKINKLLNENNIEKLEYDLQSKLKIDSVENYPFKNPINSNLNKYTNFVDNVNINHNYSMFALYNKNNNDADHVNNIMFARGNPFKNSQNNIKNNAMSAGILSGNFINPDNSQLQDKNNIDKSINNSKINLNDNNITPRDSRLSNINLLQDYKLSLDGKIDNLKKIINQKMGYSKFKNLRNEIFVNILNYFNTYDIYAVMNMNSYMKHKILAVLTDYSRIICNEFERKFSKNFLLKNSQILITNFKKNRKFYSKINLVLKFQIIDKSLKNKSIILGYLNKYYGESDCLKNFFRFDVRGPGPMSFWVMREFTSFHQDELNKAYFQHIMQFSLNDVAEININIFTDKGIIDVNSFKWLNLNEDKIPQFNFLEFTNDHNKLREVLDFDLSRFCEMEIMKNKWTDLVHNENYENIIKKIKFLFEPNFVIQKVLWDDVGYHLFKIFLIAAEKGKLNSSNEVGIKITVKGSNEPLTNEVKKNCLLFDGKNQIQLRIGDILIFYISKNK